MTTLSITHPTLLNFTTQLGPDGKIINDFAELLHLTNPILDDMVQAEGNLTNGNKSMAEVSIPDPTWRKFYGGVMPTVGSFQTITDTCGMLEAYCEVDKALADTGGNTAAFRKNQERLHIEGMTQKMALTLLTGNEKTAPESFSGFGPRYALSTGAGNSDNVLKSDEGATTNTDIWLVGWAQNKVYGFHPKGSKAGLSYEDFGEQTLGDMTNGYFQGYRSHFKWELGLAVEDWRYVSRAHCGITLANTYLSAGTGTPLSTLMIQMSERIPSLSSCRPVFYMSRKAKTLLRLQIKKEGLY